MMAVAVPCDRAGIWSLQGERMEPIRGAVKRPLEPSVDICAIHPEAHVLSTTLVRLTISYGELAPFLGERHVVVF